MQLELGLVKFSFLNFHRLCISDSLIMFVFLTHLLTPRCRVLLEQLTGLQPVKKFPAFHGTRRFITAFTPVRHPSLSWLRTLPQDCVYIPYVILTYSIYKQSCGTACSQLSGIFCCRKHRMIVMNVKNFVLC